MERRGKKESRLGDDLRRAGNARDRGSNLLKVCLIMNRSERGRRARVEKRGGRTARFCFRTFPLAE